MASSLPLRPRLCWRVGVTGHRDLGDAEQPLLQVAVAEVLSDIRKVIDDVARDAAAIAVYDLDKGSPELRLLTAMADGADRLVGREALRQGYSLDVVLPFTLADYERTLEAGATAEFRDLLRATASGSEQERVIVLDGEIGTRRRDSYMAAGQFIVRNCDLLVAIWNGEPADGWGGTGDVVRTALAAGLPVWRIDPAQPQLPQLRGVGECDGPHAQVALAHLIRQAVMPLEVARPPAHGSLGAVAHWLDSTFVFTKTPLEDYLGETPPGRPMLRRAYATLMNWVSPPPPDEEWAGPAPEGPVELWWETQHATAAAFSKVYGDRYRSSYVLVFLLAALALIAAAFGFVVPKGMHVPVAIVELVALSFVAFLVGANHLFRWHDRWISYRLLAELCRKQRILAPLGWTLPVRDVARIVTADPGHAASGSGAPPREAWVAWYFAAVRRAAPMPLGILAGPALERAKSAGLGLFEEQRCYHRQRQQRCEHASERLAHWGDMFFLLALLGVVLRIVLEVIHAPSWAIDAVAVGSFASPAVSAALLGIRAYAEFELLARQSARMQRVMVEASSEVSALQLNSPLASNTLGAVHASVVTAMLLDIDGWAQLFRVKAVEAG